MRTTRTGKVVDEAAEKIKIEAFQSYFNFSQRVLSLINETYIDDPGEHAKELTFSFKVKNGQTEEEIFNKIKSVLNLFDKAKVDFCEYDDYFVEQPDNPFYLLVIVKVSSSSIFQLNYCLMEK